MKFPWQKQTLEVPIETTPATNSAVSTSKNSTEVLPPQDGETRIIPGAEDEKPIPGAEQNFQTTIQSGTANEKETHTNLAPTTSRATTATSTEEAEEDDESKYPKTWALATLTFGLCLATFVVALDNTIIGTSPT